MTVAVLLAGGVGSRFWPRSRRHRPKQCLAVTGETSLLQQTIARLGVDESSVIVVTGPEMSELIRSQVPRAQILVEPSPRNTAAAVALGVRAAQDRGASSVVVSPTDHSVLDEPAFRGAVAHARSLSEQGAIVLLGMAPAGPSEDFGYLVLDEDRVVRFEEKPSRQRAEQLIAGGALWNAGVFVFSVSTAQRAFEHHLPGMWDAVRDSWDEVETISFDHGILERSSDVRGIRCTCGWSDLGSWNAMVTVFPETELGHARIRDGLCLGGGGNIVDAPGKTVVTIGIEDLVIVDTEDALLVCRKEDTGQLREVVRRLAARGREDLL